MWWVQSKFVGFHQQYGNDVRALVVNLIFAVYPWLVVAMVCLRKAASETGCRFVAWVREYYFCH